MLVSIFLFPPLSTCLFQSLCDTDHLRYKFLNAWDAACLALDERYNYISNSWQWATMIDDEKQVWAFVFEKEGRAAAGLDRLQSTEPTELWWQGN